MGLKLLLDTNAVLYLLGGRLAERLPPGEYLISVITEMELLAYPLLSREEEGRIREFIGVVEVVGLGEEVKVRTIEVRRSCGLKLPDAIVAATALVSGANLVTNDRRMERVPNLRVRSLLLRDEEDGVLH